MTDARWLALLLVGCSTAAPKLEALSQVATAARELADIGCASSGDVVRDAEQAAEACVGGDAAQCRRVELCEATYRHLLGMRSAVLAAKLAVALGESEDRVNAAVRAAEQAARPLRDVLAGWRH